MIPYILITAADANSLVDAVNQQIARGYQPIGGVAISVDPNQYNTVVYAQAMLLFDQDAE